jgi:endoglucanase
VTYEPNAWPGGFTANFRITNGSAPRTSWSVSFTVASGVQLANGWSGTWNQSGTTITVTNASWNGSLGAGGTTDVGFQGTYSGSSLAPFTNLTCS